MSVCCDCCVLSGRGFCDKLIIRQEEYYRLWCVVVCDIETSWMRRPCPTGSSRAKNKRTMSVVKSQSPDGADLEGEHWGRSQLVFVLCNTFVHWFVPEEVLVRFLSDVTRDKIFAIYHSVFVQSAFFAFWMLPDTWNPNLALHIKVAAIPRGSHISFSISLIDSNNSFHLKFKNPM